MTSPEESAESPATAVAGLDAINPADIRYAAMNLLARREHAFGELQQKLARRFPDADLVRAEVQKLADEGLQSDARYAESFVRQRSGRGYGLMRIRQEARHKGLGEAELALALESLEIDWFALAEETYRKKFGAGAPDDIRDKAKRSRFMQYRGFALEQFQHLME